MITTILIAAIISSVGILQILMALSRKQRERLLRHRGKVNLIMHLCVFYVFIGTITGLIQAELCAIMLTIVFGVYAKKCSIEDKRMRVTRSEARSKL